jgi:SH3-like domain-containing protein
MKKTKMIVTAILSLLSLSIVDGVRAETTIDPVDNGNLSVTGMIPGNGCTVLFSPQGEIIQKGNSCSSREINKAQDAIDSYLREQNADDQNGRRGGYADSEDGGPDFWEITGVANNNLGLKAQPSLDSDFTVQGLRNGTILRNLGCKDRNGDRWCRVEVEDNPSQNGWARMQYLRESGRSSRSSSNGNSGALRPGEAEVVNAGRNGIDLASSPYTPDSPNRRGLRNGTQVRVEGCNTEKWCRVELQDGSKMMGWIRSTNLRQY